MIPKLARAVAFFLLRKYPLPKREDVITAPITITKWEVEGQLSKEAVLDLIKVRMQRASMLLVREIEELHWK